MFPSSFNPLEPFRVSGLLASFFSVFPPLLSRVAVFLVYFKAEEAKLKLFFAGTTIDAGIYDHKDFHGFMFI